MFSSTLMLLVCASAGVYIVQGDSPVINPDVELCSTKDPCADLDGFCCEGLRGNCCVNGQCTNSTVCKVKGERCGRVRCSKSQTCVRSQPCVCCPNCFVPILPTCKPKCGSRACYRNEVCTSSKNGGKTIKKCVKRLINPIVDPVLPSNT